jgi:acetyltransferase-like isoleucine patch superfamily enzyme
MFNNSIYVLIQNELWAWYERLFGIFPGKVGILLRILVYKPFFKKLGKKVEFREDTNITFPTRIIMNNSIKIGRGVIINATGGVILKDHVRVGPNSMIISTNHNFGDIGRSIDSQGVNYKEIIIEEDVWVGAHVKILSGANIGAHSVVGAGSVVTSIIPPYSIVVGNPGRVIANRKKNDKHKRGE